MEGEEEASLALHPSLAGSVPWCKTWRQQQQQQQWHRGGRYKHLRAQHAVQLHHIGSKPVTHQ